MFSNTLSFLSSLNISDQVSHPYKTTSKIIVPYILIFKVLDSKLEDKAGTGLPHKTGVFSVKVNTCDLTTQKQGRHQPLEYPAGHTA